MNTTNQDPSPPWWRFGHVWLVIAGPVVVILAGLVTVWLAMSAPDPVLASDYYRRGVEINKELASKATMPAVQGRNHAASPPPGAVR